MFLIETVYHEWPPAELIRPEFDTASIGYKERPFAVKDLSRGMTVARKLTAPADAAAPIFACLVEDRQGGLPAPSLPLTLHGYAAK